MKINMRNNNWTVILSTVIIYYLLAFVGFSILSRFGIYYNGSEIHIYAIPMMVVISLYVYFINGKLLFRKEDFLPRKENLLLFLIPYIVIAATLLSIAETIVMKRSLPDVLCMALLTFLIGVSEEGMFRLFILKDCNDSLKKKVLLYAVSVITFGALHMMNVGGGLAPYDAFIQSVNAMSFGLIAGFLFLRTGNISAMIFWHMHFDFDIFALQEGIYRANTLLGLAVEIILIISLVLTVLQMIMSFVKKTRASRNESGKKLSV